MGPLMPVGSSFIRELIKVGSYDKIDKDARKPLIISDLIKVGGYFPGVSVITGVARLIFFFYAIYARKKENDPIKGEERFFIGQHIARGILEITCVVGPALLVADVFATAVFSYREMQEKKRL